MKFLTLTALLAVAKAGTCTEGTENCECDGDNGCLEVGDDCVADSHAQCDANTLKIVASPVVVVGACESGTENCVCDETNAENCLEVGTVCEADSHSACGDELKIEAPEDVENNDP